MAPIIICGPYRTGKSFLANQILQRSRGFKIGNSTNPCTTGIWVWEEPIETTVMTENSEKKVKCLILDCEGANSISKPFK